MNPCEDCPFGPCFCPKRDTGADCCRTFVCPFPPSSEEVFGDA